MRYNQHKYNIYLKPHTLRKMACPEGTMSNHLTQLLSINSLSDKRFIAMQKILAVYHRNPNMAPIFEWDLKVLPYLVDWFDEFRKRWKDTCPGVREEVREEATAELSKRKLSVMYQFVGSKPLMCVLTRSHRGIKRKHAHAV